MIKRFCCVCGHEFEAENKNNRLCSSKCIESDYPFIDNNCGICYGKIDNRPYEIIFINGMYKKIHIKCQHEKLKSSLKLFEHSYNALKNDYERAKDKLEKYEDKFKSELVSDNL